MNAPQVHLMFNHVPVIGILFVIVTLAVGLWSRRAPLLRFGLATLLVLSIVAVPVYFSGGRSEGTIEKLAGVRESTIEQHEAAARAASVALGVLGLGAVLALIRYRRRDVPRAIGATMLVTAVVVSGALAWTAHLGGQIRHEELSGTRSAAVAPGEAGEHE